MVVLFLLFCSFMLLSASFLFLFFCCFFLFCYVTISLFGLTLSLQSRCLSTFGVDIEPLVTPSFLTPPVCFDKQLTQQGQIHPHVCPFSISTKFWQSYSRKTCPILGAKLVVNRPSPIVDQSSISRFFEGLRPKLSQWTGRG